MHAGRYVIAGRHGCAAGVVLWVFCAASTAQGQPVGGVEILRGKVAVRTVSDGAIVALDESGDGLVDHVFRIQDHGLLQTPVTLPPTRAHALSWAGHLVVIAPAQGTALHFSIGAEIQIARAGYR
jgi:hypothetical protein